MDRQRELQRKMDEETDIMFDLVRRSAIFGLDSHGNPLKKKFKPHRAKAEFEDYNYNRNNYNGERRSAIVEADGADRVLVLRDGNGADGVNPDAGISEGRGSTPGNSLTTVGHCQEPEATTNENTGDRHVGTRETCALDDLPRNHEQGSRLDSRASAQDDSRPDPLWTTSSPKGRLPPRKTRREN
jgi:hypothetical protein